MVLIGQRREGLGAAPPGLGVEASGAFLEVRRGSFRPAAFFAASSVDARWFYRRRRRELVVLEAAGLGAQR